MKYLKIPKSKPTVTREIIQKIGEVIYHAQDVESVDIEVEFKDGTSIKMNRDEHSDRIQKRIEDFEKEDE